MAELDLRKVVVDGHVSKHMKSGELGVDVLGCNEDKVSELVGILQNFCLSGGTATQSTDSSTQQLSLPPAGTDPLGVKSEQAAERPAEAFSEGSKQSVIDTERQAFSSGAEHFLVHNLLQEAFNFTGDLTVDIELDDDDVLWLHCGDNFVGMTESELRDNIFTRAGGVEKGEGSAGGFHEGLKTCLKLFTRLESKCAWKVHTKKVDMLTHLEVYGGDDNGQLNRFKRVHMWTPDFVTNFFDRHHLQTDKYTIFSLALDLEAFPDAQDDEICLKQRLTDEFRSQWQYSNREDRVDLRLNGALIRNRMSDALRNGEAITLEHVQADFKCDIVDGQHPLFDVVEFDKFGSSNVVILSSVGQLMWHKQVQANACASRPNRALCFKLKINEAKVCGRDRTAFAARHPCARDSDTLLTKWRVDRECFRDTKRFQDEAEVVENIDYRVPLERKFQLARSTAPVLKAVQEKCEVGSDRRGCGSAAGDKNFEIKDAPCCAAYGRPRINIRRRRGDQKKHTLREPAVALTMELWRLAVEFVLGCVKCNITEFTLEYLDSRGLQQFDHDMDFRNKFRWSSSHTPIFSFDVPNFLEGNADILHFGQDTLFLTFLHRFVDAAAYEAVHTRIFEHNHHFYRVLHHLLSSLHMLLHTDDSLKHQLRQDVCELQNRVRALKCPCCDLTLKPMIGAQAIHTECNQCGKSVRRNMHCCVCENDLPSGAACTMVFCQQCCKDRATTGVAFESQGGAKRMKREAGA